MKHFTSISFSIGLVVAAAVLLGGLLGNAVPVAAGVSTAQTDILGPTGSGQFGARVVALPSGNIVVTDPSYDSGVITDVGAVYLYNGATRALISTLTGSTAGDQVGSGGVVTLENGNYVVLSPLWSNGAAAHAGAATWGNGTTGIAGVVSVTNSLVGSQTGDFIGAHGVTVLADGNYVVLSPDWDNDGRANAGAATWGDGATGVTGVVSVSNSLVGSTAGDQVGSGVTALAYRNYVVLSPLWNNGVLTDTGAATWGNGATGITGVVSVTNSLVGSTANDQVGLTGVAALANGNYVVLSLYWNNGLVVDAGAATWGNGMTGITGVITVANSLVGSATGDFIGEELTALANGNYVVYSPLWDNGVVTDAGAATWGNGTTGITGVVTVANSLVGSVTDDQVGFATALANGNYVVYSLWWNNGAVADTGAVTWGNGTTGVTGVVNVTNSLVGGASSDQISYYGVRALSNGNYVVSSSLWNNGGVLDAGAATWGNGVSGTTGVVSVTNSLVGDVPFDQVGYEVAALDNGNYVVRSPYWDNNAATDAGAVTWGDGTIGVTGTVTAENSVRGTAAGGGTKMVFAYDYANDQLIVGRPADNIVTLFRPPSYGVFLPLVLRNAGVVSSSTARSAR